MLLQTGRVRIAVLDAGGAKTKTLILPAPSKGYPELTWDEKFTTVDLVDGSPRTRTLGFVPVLRLAWEFYDDRKATGTAEGQTPDAEALLGLLSAPTGTLRVSPGLTAGGFTADSIKVEPINKQGNVYGGLEVTFTSRNILATRTLETF